MDKSQKHSDSERQTHLIYDGRDTAILIREVFLNYTDIYVGLENREYGRRDPLRWPRDTLYPQKLALTSPTRGSRSVGIVLSRTKATEFIFF
jgi:hypothetical protein